MAALQAGGGSAPFAGVPPAAAAEVAAALGAVSSDQARRSPFRARAGCRGGGAGDEGGCGLRLRRGARTRAAAGGGGRASGARAGRG